MNLTLRAAQQVYDKTGGYAFKGLRVVEMGRVKSFEPGKVEKGEAMEAKVILELTYLMIEVDGNQLLEVDKLNGVYKVNGEDKPRLFCVYRVSFRKKRFHLDLKPCETF